MNSYVFNNLELKRKDFTDKLLMTAQVGFKRKVLEGIALSVPGGLGWIHVKSMSAPNWQKRRSASLHGHCSMEAPAVLVLAFSG